MTAALRAIAGGKHTGRDILRTLPQAPPGQIDMPKVKPGSLDTYNSHPGAGLTVEMLLSYYRQAERGYPVKQFDCFDDLVERNGHLRGLINGRIDAVAGCDFVIAPGRDDVPSRVAAAALDDHLRNSNIGFQAFIEHHLMAPHYGFSVTNTVWGIEERAVLPTEFIHAPPRRFAAPNEQAHLIWLITGDTSRDLMPLEPGEFAVARYRGRNPYAAGLMRTGAFWAMVAGWSLRDWLTFAEMFGLPLVLGFYQDGAPLAARLALEDAIKAIGEDGYAVLSDLVEVVIKDTARSGDSSTVYPRIQDKAEQQMSKLFAGSTTASDTGGDVGSYALGTVHESRAYKLSLSDARLVERTVREHICVPYTIWNGFDRAAPPRMGIKITRDSLERAQTLALIGQLVDLDPDQIYEEFSLRPPAAGRGVRMPSKTQPADGKPGAKPAAK